MRSQISTLSYTSPFGLDSGNTILTTTHLETGAIFCVSLIPVSTFPAFLFETLSQWFSTFLNVAKH